MSKLTSDGFDEIFAQMDALGEMATDTVDDMLTAGADIVVRKWEEQDAAVMTSRTGSLRGSIKATKIRKLKGAKTIDVYPQGNRKDDGKRNADVAFILNYASRYPRQNGWIDRAETLAEQPVYTAYETVWNNRLKQLNGGQ